MSNMDILGWASAAACSALALLAAWRHERAFARWVFVAGMFVLAVEGLFLGLTADAVVPAEKLRWETWELVAMSFLPGVWLLFSLVYARGNYREFLKRWRIALLAAFLAPVGLAVIFASNLFTTSFGQTKTGDWMFELGAPGMILNLLYLLGAVLVLMNLEGTYRAAVGTMRWRIKFMILGLGLIFAVQAYVSSQTLLFHNSVNLSLQGVGMAAVILGCLLMLRSLFRAGHFLADVYPPHAAVYNSFAVILAGIYLLSVGVFANVVAFFGGGAAFALKAFVLLIAVVVLAVIALSDRVRLHTRRFFSRHFQRPLYDYRSVWKSFIEGTASCVKQAELCQTAVKLVSEIFQVLSVTIWLVDDRRENFGFAASTFLSEAKGNELSIRGQGAMDVMHALGESRDPVDVDASQENWAALVRGCQPDEFRKGGNRVCVPMTAGGELQGMITLGDRVGGVPFSWQDFDLLKCVGDEIAASLLNLQLSRKLMQAGEMEAFQTMSAFFVHDLKNTTTTLNLMLKNLPGNFDDPAFREDTLRGIAKTVAHINHLIARLGQLRSGLQIKPAPADLNDLVLQALAGLEETADVQLVKNLQPLPRLLLDREQMLKVVTNLVFNAREAVSSAGEVRIETSQANGWAVLAVADNGCGMNPEFVSRSLFRPFQTTKKNGLGIGLFQSKMIVEAHRGRIQVESQPGKGTTFRLILPLPKPN